MGAFSGRECFQASGVTQRNGNCLEGRTERLESWVPQQGSAKSSGNGSRVGEEVPLAGCCRAGHETQGYF